jgi:hypothetical protein
MCITDFLITFKISKIEIHEVEEILPVHGGAGTGYGYEYVLTKKRIFHEIKLIKLIKNL